MQLTQLTNYGESLMRTATAPIVVTGYKLGSDFNYVPTREQTNIRGSLIASGIPAAPVVETANFINYYVELGDNQGPFEFGEIGLFVGNELFAICVLDAPMVKLPLDPNTNTGGAVVISFNVPSIGMNYQMWTNTSQANTTKVSQVAGPEELPQLVGKSPNLYVVDSTNGSKPFLAYVDRNGLWSFDSYSEIGRTGVLEYIDDRTLKISAQDASRMEIEPGMTANLLVQVAGGEAFASVRWVASATLDGLSGGLILQLNAPVWKPVVPGIPLEFYRLGSPSSTTVNLSAILTVKDVGPNYTLMIDDALAVYVRCTSASPTSVIIPDNATVPFSIGTNILIGWAGTGQVGVIGANPSVQIRTPSTNLIAQKDGKMAIIQTAINVWELEGNLQQA